MCADTWIDGCGCYATQAEFDADTARIQRAACYERELYALLRGEAIEPSPATAALHALLLCECPEAAELVSDLMTSEDGCILWYWIGGDQRELVLEARVALRLVA